MATIPRHLGKPELEQSAEQARSLGAGTGQVTELASLRQASGATEVQPQSDDQTSMAAASGPPSGSLVARGIFCAAKGKINLLVGSMAATSAALFQSWSMFALAAAAYVAMIAWDLSSLEFWRRTLREEANSPPLLPDLSGLTDTTAIVAVQRIADARARLQAVLDETSEDIRQSLTAALRRVDVLERHALSLVERIDELGRYLASSTPELLKAEMAHVDRRLRHARDEGTRDQYRMARDARQQQMSALDEITSTRERLAATLDNVLGTLECLPARIVRLRMLQTEASKAEPDDGLGDVTLVHEEMQRVEDAMRALMLPVGDEV